MKTVICDGQLWQTNAWYRGMGLYTRSLLSEYKQLESNDRIIIILNRNLNTSKERQTEIRTEFPYAEIHYLDLPTNESHERAAVNLLDKFLATNNLQELPELTYIIFSLFMFDYCANFPSKCKKILLHYDLIPLIYWKDFQNLFPASLYFKRFKRFFEANHILTISATSANDIKYYLGIPKEKITVIDGAADYPTRDARQSTKSDVIERFNLSDKVFILMPTGGFSHKNAVRAVQAFVQLCSVLSREVILVATSFYKETEKQELELLSDKVVFTGNISEDDMAVLFTKCRTVLMPSLYEGLGLPALEGICYGKPVACSDIPVFREIPHCAEALYLFNPYDIDSICNSLLSALAEADFINKRVFYKAIKKKYNWSRSAKLLRNVMDLEYNPDSSRVSNNVKIAVTCPDPRADGLIGQAAQRLWGYAHQLGIEIVYFIDSGGSKPTDPANNPDYVRHLARSYDINDFHSLTHSEDFTKVVHFISENPVFYFGVFTALTEPGIVYIASKNYRYTMKEIGRRGLINAAQQASEQFIAEHTAQHICNGLSLIANATGLVVEIKYDKALQNACEFLDCKTERLIVELIIDEKTETNLDKQNTDYTKILDYVVASEKVRTV